MLEEVSYVRYLSVDLTAAGNQAAEIQHRVWEGVKVMVALRSVWKERSVSIQTKIGVFDGIVQ